MEVYQPLLPGAIQRFAGSQKLIQTVNNQLSQQMTPGSMVEPYDPYGAMITLGTLGVKRWMFGIVLRASTCDLFDRLCLLPAKNLQGNWLTIFLSYLSSFMFVQSVFKLCSTQLLSNFSKETADMHRSCLGITAGWIASTSGTSANLRPRVVRVHGESLLIFQQLIKLELIYII